MVLYLYLALLTTGLVLSYYSYSFYNKTNNLVDNGVKTTAVVSKLVYVPDYDGSGGDKPYFTFTDRNNKEHTFTNGISSSPPAFKLNEKVKVIYNPKDTEEVKVVSFWGLYRWSVILLMIAAPFLVISISYLSYLWK